MPPCGILVRETVGKGETMTSDAVTKDLWERARTIYLSSIMNAQDRSQAENYFLMITSVTKSNGVFTAFTSNKFSADFLRDHYSEKLKLSFSLAGAADVSSVDFQHDPAQRQSIIVPAQTPRSRPQKTHTQQIPAQRTASFTSTLPLEETYTFEEFVQGSSNSWAFAAAKGVANNPGQKNYNPLFIHGGTGLGKTHLMQAIGNELKRKNPMMSVCYLTAETFLNEYVNALQQKGMDSFREKYRSIDVLLVDDIQFLQKGKQFQEEFFNTFNDLTTNHKQVVMTSDVAPKNLPALEERLISRFEGGMVQEIEAPGYETRLAILKKKAENLTPSIPTATLEFLADNIKSHVRAMEGALSKVHVAISINPTQPLSNEFLSILLKDFIEKEQTLKRITVREVQECVAKKYGVSLAQILSPDRTQSLVTPRQLAMYISRQYAVKSSLSEVAEAFNKTHATVVHGVKTIKKRLDVEEDLRQSLEEILKEFGYNISDKNESTT